LASAMPVDYWVIAMARSKPSSALAAEEVATILDCIADGVFTVDRHFVITSFNRAAEEITGFSAEEAIGEKCYNIFRASVCQTDCLLAEVIRTGRSITGLELTILDRQNNDVHISVSNAVLRNKEGDTIGGVKTFRDLTAVDSFRREVRRRYCFRDMVGKNRRMQDIFDLVPDVAASDATVLIYGETGAGKEPLARAIHDNSPRSEQAFVKVNCAALPDSLLESELFGHVAGAFTDARTDRKGRFELANHGTILLDEIGDTSPTMQAKLLRVVQEGKYEAVGSSETRSVDVRVIAATHRDIKDLIARDKFRKDLYYRINTVVLSLPPLRERREDIPLLAEHFIEHFSGLTGKRVRNIAPDAMNTMMRYPWPGNVRELENTIEHAFILVKNSTIRLEHLPEELTRPIPCGPVPCSTRSEGLSSLADTERQIIEAALDRHHWNRAEACKELGISRSTLWRKMQRLGIRST
jgi:PAS domain S-box-containing protein